MQQIHIPNLLEVEYSQDHNTAFSQFESPNIDVKI